jgi:hypothetical protein
LADISLLHPPKCTPQTIDNNASLPPVSGAAPGLRPGAAPRVPPSLGAAPCPSVRARHRPPVRRQPRPPTRQGGGPWPPLRWRPPRVHQCGRGPGFPHPGRAACPAVQKKHRVPPRPMAAHQCPPSRPGLTPGFPPRARPAHTVPFPPWASVPGTTVGPPPRDYPWPHVPPRDPQCPGCRKGGGVGGRAFWGRFPKRCPPEANPLLWPGEDNKLSGRARAVDHANDRMSTTDLRSDFARPYFYCSCECIVQM